MGERAKKAASWDCFYYKWNREKSDALCWVGEHGNDYTVRSGYRALKGALEIADADCFRVVWDLKISGKAKIFGWRAMLDRLPSRVNLETRGVIMSCNLCPLCRKEMETLQHLLITCEVAQRLWIKCDSWAGITSARNNVIHFCNFTIIGMSNKANGVWKGMWLSLAKEIWNYRIKIIFNSGQVDEIEIFATTQLHAWTWAKFNGSRFQSSFE